MLPYSSHSVRALVSNPLGAVLAGWSCLSLLADPVTPPSGIIGWWPGDGDVSNLVGTPGTLEGEGDFAPGMVGQAFRFNGSGPSVATDLDVQPSALPTTTWEAWVYPTVVKLGSRQQILSDDSGGYGRSLLIEYGTTNFGVFTGSGVWQPTEATTNTWQHVAVVFTPTNIYFYKDGVPFEYGSKPVGQSSSRKLTIGRNPSHGEFFNGLIDEVSVYDRALSAAEIQGIYAAGADGKAKSGLGSADLGISLQVSPESVSIWSGQKLTNQVVVVNQGPDPAIGTTFSLTLPPGVTRDSVSLSAGSWSQSGSTLYAALGNLASGASATFTLVMTPSTLATVTNVATVTSLADDPMPGNNTASAVTRIYGRYTPEDGDWLEPVVVLTNTPEADLMVRVGDIDNLGFSWPAGFNVFSGATTPVHAFPWTVKTNDPAGTDRIMLGTSYNGHPPHGSDGYTSSTTRPANLPESVVLEYDLGGRKVSSAAFQIFVDDFQAPVWGSSFRAWLNDIRAPFLETLLNSLVQTGPVGKLITVAIPSEYLPQVQSGKLELLIDDPTTGAGDGYSLDFVKMLVNVKGFTQGGTIEGTVIDSLTRQPMAGATVSAQGWLETATDAQGHYILTNVTAGLVFVTASAPDCGSALKSTDLVVGKTVTLNFELSLQPILRIELLDPTQVRVSWPGGLTGFTLQKSDALGSPTSWASEGSVPALVEGRNAVTNTIPPSALYYRLVK